MNEDRKYSSDLGDANFTEGQPDLIWNHENVLDLDDFALQEIETVITRYPRRQIRSDFL